MTESGGGNRRGEPLLEMQEKELAKAPWRLNVEEFRLPNQTHDHHHHRFFSFGGLLRKPSKISSFFILFCSNALCGSKKCHC